MFLREELEKYRLNVRRSDETYKITTARVRQFMGRYLPNNIISSVMIALETYLPAVLYEEGYEIIYKSKSTIIVRRRVMRDE